MLLPGWFHDWILGLRGHRPSDLATVIFSSGSTGEPKGVALTYQNVTSNIEIFKDAVDFSPRDRVLGILPFFHSFGYTVTLWGALGRRRAPSTMPTREPHARSANCAGCTAAPLMAATATFLRLYLRRCGPDDFKSMALARLRRRKAAARAD